MNPERFDEDPNARSDRKDSGETEVERRDDETRPFQELVPPRSPGGGTETAPSERAAAPRSGSSVDPEVTPIRPLKFSQIEGEGEGGAGSLELLMDVKLPVSVELGRSEVLIKEILEYGTGSVIQLNKGAGDPVDILINGRLVAQGEVVVVDDHFGVRISTLLSPQERARSLA